ncbi:hypothetical protein CVT25_001997 [Psilocybe cyanescens]|uniref:Uncharacterized protein n=1 Tax=Psilocybe cyanescens TaxID=93625 RepID=A0A409W9Y3_PSICY|nr:hypothetical protein CVT25_001997 [Psilocybe cyanescens]
MGGMFPLFLHSKTSVCPILSIHLTVGDVRTTRDINPFTAADFDAVEGRRLEFLSKDLGHDIDLLLVFDPPKDAGRIFVDFFPVAWKIVSFTATGTSSAVILFTGRAAFIVPQMNSGNIVFSANAQACEPKLGEQCTLKVNEKGVSFLTEAEVGTPGIMKCINDTEAPAKIGLVGQILTQNSFK